MTYVKDILMELDQRFPVPNCDMERGCRTGCADKEMFWNADGNWLEYGTLCLHDDGFMCDARMEAIRQFIKGLYSPGPLAKEEGKL